jgi:hypothetical protein
MCLLYILYAKDFLVRYSRRLFLNLQMLHSLDKVGFKYRGFAYFKGFICITFSLLTKLNKK